VKTIGQAKLTLRALHPCSSFVKLLLIEVAYRCSRERFAESHQPFLFADDRNPLDVVEMHGMSLSISYLPFCLFGYKRQLTRANRATGAIEIP